MHGSVIVGWDGTAEAHDALALADALFPVSGAETAVHVYDDATGAARAFDGLVAPGVERLAIAGRSVAHTLHTVVAERGADMLVVGSTSSGVDGRVRTGPVGEQLTDAPHCPVAIAPKGYRSHAHRLADVSVVFDAQAQVASCADEGAALAVALGADLSLVCVMPPLEQWARDSGEDVGRCWSDVTRRRRLEFERILVGAARRVGVPASRVRVLDGRPLELLVEEAGEGADLLVTSAPPCGALHRVLLGGQAAALRAVPVPVVVVPCPLSPARRSQTGGSTVTHAPPAMSSGQ